MPLLQPSFTKHADEVSRVQLLSQRGPVTYFFPSARQYFGQHGPVRCFRVQAVWQHDRPASQSAQQKTAARQHSSSQDSTAADVQPCGVQASSALDNCGASPNSRSPDAECSYKHPAQSATDWQQLVAETAKVLDAEPGCTATDRGNEMADAAARADAEYSDSPTLSKADQEQQAALEVAWEDDFVADALKSEEPEASKTQPPTAAVPEAAVPAAGGDPVSHVSLDAWLAHSPDPAWLLPTAEAPDIAGSPAEDRRASDGDRGW